jgi:uncharacterized protein YkwD
MVPTTKNSLLYCCLLTIFLVAGVGCDTKEDDSTSAPGTGNPIDNPNLPVPEPIPTDELPSEEGKLNVTGVFPGPGEPRVALVSAISVQFDADLIQGLDLSDAIQLQSPAGPVAGTVTQTEADTLVFRPAQLWLPTTVYSITLDSALMSADGLPLVDDVAWQFITVADVYTTPQAIIDGCMSDLDVEMLASVNLARAQARLCGENNRLAVPKLVWNCRIQQAAIGHSEDMATQDFFEHTGSDGSSVADRVTRAGYQWSSVGENIAAGQRTVAVVMAGLLNSPGHCENIMSASFTEFGFGYRTNPNSLYERYWTQNFARPFTNSRF